MGVRVKVGVVAAALAALIVAAPAHAAFPGQNGKIAYYRPATAGAPTGIWTINPDGSGESQLVPPTGSNARFAPAWAADGTKIAYGGVTTPSTASILAATSTGAGETPLITGPDGNTREPAWSSGGDRVAFLRSTLDPNNVSITGLAVMNADGTAATDIVQDAPVAAGPAWSPDGARIAFPQGSTLYLVNPDGSNKTPLAELSEPVGRPSWSPDGAKVVFQLGSSCGNCPNDLYTVNADGTGLINITNTPAVYESAPAWSPDGTKIAFEHYAPSGVPQIYTMNPDGTGVAPVTTIVAHDPDWQPVILGAYPRPKAATPLYASLVPAYRVCQAPNRVHAAPLSYSSCNPPTIASSTLTVGTPDANANPANFTGSARYRVIAGNPGTPLDEADVAVDVSLADVRCAITSAACPGGPLSDYTGRLLLINPPLQLTDKDGQPATGGQGAATGQTNFPVPFDCTPTVSATIGSSCSLSTTADAVVPNVIKEGHRAIWESGPVHVRDAGPNGTGFGAGCPPACGDGDETLFLRQGVFVP